MGSPEFDELFRDLYGMQIPAHGASLYKAFNGPAGATVNLGSLLTAGKRYYLLSNEDVHICTEADAGAGTINCDTNDTWIPGGTLIPFQPKTGALGLSMRGRVVGGTLFVIRAANLTVSG